MNLTLFLPEISLLLTIGLLLVLACRKPDARRDYAAATAAAAAVVVFSLAGSPLSGTLFGGSYRIDLFSQVFKVFIASGFFLVVFLCSEFQGISPDSRTEGYLLLAVSTLAMMLMTSAVHLVALFLALELSSYSLYLLVFIRRPSHWGLACGLRFFIIGASISAVMLLGMALLYSVTGTLALDALVRQLPALITRPIVAGSVLLVMAGFFFKLALFPFHTWAPDTYEGAPNQVAAFVATVSKLAAIAVLLRIISLTQGSGDLLAKGLIALAIASMTVGNLAAIAQNDFKRLMAFSSIAHAGYLLIGILCMTPDSYRATMFYAVAVLTMKFTCFMVMIKVAADGRNLQISELAGLHRRSPLLALALMMALFGLGGIPPTIGFTGKFLIFTAAIAKGYLALVIIAMVNVVISLYYYLLVLKAAYLDEPARAQAELSVSYPDKILAVAMISVMMVVGFYPNALLNLVQAAALNLP
ncbi:MAG: NADH-quinone oxidoreductase subunit N [Desulfosarcinaceae bacterium]